jgi:putative hydrolase of the HAD superfamily
MPMETGTLTRLRAVLFDAVGTLIALREPVGETYARHAHDHGLVLPAARIQEAFTRVWARAAPMVFRGPDAAERERAWWRGVVRETFREAARDAAFPQLDACFEALWDHYSGAGAWLPRPGARRLLATLAERGLARGVVSNFDRRLPALLRALGLPADAVVLPSDAGAAKPDPRIFHLALRRLGVPAAAALHVGDHPERDLAAARRAGLRAVDVAGLAYLGELVRQLDLPPAQELPP